MGDISPFGWYLSNKKKITKKNKRNIIASNHLKRIIKSLTILCFFLLILIHMKYLFWNFIQLVFVEYLMILSFSICFISFRLMFYLCPIQRIIFWCVAFLVRQLDCQRFFSSFFLRFNDQLDYKWICYMFRVLVNK